MSCVDSHHSTKGASHDRTQSPGQAETPQVTHANPSSCSAGHPTRSAPAAPFRTNLGNGRYSEAGQAVLKALSSLVKFVPAGSVTPAAQKNSIEVQQRNMAQNNQQMQALKQRLQGGGGAPGGGQPPAPQPGMAA